VKLLDEQTVQQTANEACLLLNESIRELITPSRVLELTDQWLKLNPVPMSAIYAVRSMVARSVIINLYRLKETRQGFLVEWLFSEDELLALSFPPIEHFFPLAKWGDFEMLRHQFAGHATGAEAKPGRPARMLPAARLGKALKETGLYDLGGFLKRIQDEILPGVESVRDALTSKYPKTRTFVTETYPLEIDAAASGTLKSGSNGIKSAS
jgi:hypothetical protein